ncbi:MAG: sugar transferase [Oscillospiraceae bacterium]|nr:sugar transferase [Oscillospiraceae bacterium]
MKGENTFYCRYIKRVLDIICALLAMIVFCWLYAVVAILVRIKLGSPVIFKQERPGEDEKIFTLYKFRTMTDARDENGSLLPDDMRLTKFGRRLRNTSLDELPEALNILKGDMSVIGPRPQLVRDMVFMTQEQRRRHCVRPGLSGWAQINGRNCIEWEDKFMYDLEYIKNVSFWIDVKIVIITVVKVFKSESINFEGMATAEDYGDYLLRTGKIERIEYNTRQRESKERIAAGR